MHYCRRCTSRLPGRTSRTRPSPRSLAPSRASRWLAGHSVKWHNECMCFSLAFRRPLSALRRPHSVRRHQSDEAETYGGIAVACSDSIDPRGTSMKDVFKNTIAATQSANGSHLCASSAPPLVVHAVTDRAWRSHPCLANLVELLPVLARARRGEVRGAVQQEAREQDPDCQQPRKFALSVARTASLTNAPSWTRPRL